MGVECSKHGQSENHKYHLGDLSVDGDDIRKKLTKNMQRVAFLVQPLCYCFHNLNV
jgi:hypothetical protein